MRTLGQKRSEFALSKTLKILEELNDPNLKKEFASFVAGVPTMILQNGFGLSIAFLVSKGKDKHKDVLEIIKEWLENNNFIKKTNSYSDMIKNISAFSQKEYLAAQKETLALLEWVKRYAQAFCS